MNKQKPNFDWTAIILAAGSSSRMGRSKQLIKIGEETLIQKTAKSAIAAGASKTIVVTGANQVAVENALKNFPVEFVFNSKWELGMGSSLKCGLSYMLNRQLDVNAALILVCDQPFITAAHLTKILDEFHQTKNPIVASFYSGKNGVPALFHKSMFTNLLTIDDQQGAKKVIEQNSALVKSVDFLKGEIDLDTPEDLLNLTI